MYASDFDFMFSDSKECGNSHRSTCMNNSYDTVSESKIQVGKEGGGVDCDKDGNINQVHDGDVGWI